MLRGEDKGMDAVLALLARLDERMEQLERGQRSLISAVADVRASVASTSSAQTALQRELKHQNTRVENTLKMQNPHFKFHRCFAALSVELAHAILMWIPPSQVLAYRRLSRMFNNLILSPYFAHDNIGLFRRGIGRRADEELERRFFAWPDPFQQSYVMSTWNLEGRLELEFACMQLRGRVPRVLGSVHSMTKLVLRENQLEGSIPPEFGNLQRLEELDLSYNCLSGCLPPELFRARQLKTLNVCGNQLIGPIPPTVGQLNNLIYLDLSENGLTGFLPPQCGQLENCRELYLSFNELEGPLPEELSSLTRITHLFLQNNKFTGDLRVLGRLGSLCRLEANDNQFSGGLKVLGNLVSLFKLQLANNNLTGPIPSNFMNLVNLCSFNAVGNKVGAWHTWPADIDYNSGLGKVLRRGLGWA